MVVKEIKENNISPGVTDGEIPSSVFISPNTTHGCLPISVKIQPDVLAINGKAIAKGIIFKYHLCPSILSSLEAYKPYSPSRNMIPPIPVIIRNTQNNKVTFGI